jgi:hypothetical protein
MEHQPAADATTVYAMINSGTLYLIIGAGLIFGACAYAAKRILRQLTLKQVGLIGVVTLLTIGAIWGFISISSRRHDSAQPLPDVNQPTPFLQSAPN